MANQKDSIRENILPESKNLDWSFHDLADFLPDAILILNETMQIVYINAAADQMFGYQEFELLGQSLDLLLPEKYQPAHGQNFSRFLVGEEHVRRMGEGRVVYGKHRSGLLMPLDISLRKREYQDQVFLICVPRNISEQIANKQAFSETEQRYRGMIDSQNNLVVRLNREGCFVFANQAYCDMFGKNLDELIGSSFAPLVHPDDLPATQLAMKRLEKPPYRVQIVQRAMTMDGWRWFAWEDSIIQDSTKNFYEIQAVGVDITEHKKIESELSNKITLLSGLINSIPDIVFFKDVSGVYLGANHEFARFLGKPVDEIVGKSDYDLFDRPTAEFFSENDRRMMELGKQRHNEEWIKYPDGEQVLLDTLKAPLYDAQTKIIGILGISRDITSRKRLEEIAIAERNLAIILAQKSTVADALPSVLDLALHVSEMDCGGIYLVDQQSQDLVLKLHRGLSDEFASRVSRFPAGTAQYNVVMKGDAIYQPYLNLPTSKNLVAINEGLHISAVIPVKFNEKVIACLNVASHIVDDMPEYRRLALENLSFQIGNMIARFMVQAELVESQNELQSMFDSLMDYIFVLDEQGLIIQVNKKVVDSLRYSREELIGKNVLLVHPPEQHVRAWKIVQDMLAGLVDACPLDLLKKDGSYIPVETKVARGRWGNRDVLIGVSRDITERKAAEAVRLEQTSLLEYRQKFEETLTSISTRFINLPTPEINLEFTRVLKQIGEFEQVDRGYVFMINHEAAMMTNTHEWCAAGIDARIDNLKDVPTAKFPWWMEKLEKLDEIYIPIVSQLPDEAQAERENLEEHAIQSMLVVPLVAHNALIGFLGFDSVARPRFWSPDSILLIKMVGDILSNALMRKKMESDLMQSETRNTALLSAVPDMIFRLSREGTFLDYKASSQDLLALPTDHIVGSLLKAFMPESSLTKAMDCISAALETKTIQAMEYTLKIGDSSHVFEARFKDSGVEEVTAIVRDISDRARLEGMKSDFINRATHELRTPIATMLLMVNLIDGGVPPAEHAEYWGVLKSELDRERLLVEDILSAGRLESNQVNLHFRYLDIDDLIKQVAHRVELPAREKDIKLTIHSQAEQDETSVIINGDESSLSQVFVNLIGNAIKFTPPGGEVDVSLEKQQAGIKISIVDTGIGIPSEDLPHLFNRFFRGSNAIHNEIQGTGIGLFIVRSILEKHGGTIKVNSELGQGSQFTIYLPYDHQ